MSTQKKRTRNRKKPEIKAQINHPVVDSKYLSGLKVEAPVKLYQCQNVMIAKIIKGLQTGQNSLIESPTGTGKTLALLCSTLFWQQDAQKKAEEDLVSQCELQAGSSASPDLNASTPTMKKSVSVMAPPSTPSAETLDQIRKIGLITPNMDDSDDFKPSNSSLMIMDTSGASSMDTPTSFKRKAVTQNLQRQPSSKRNRPEESLMTGEEVLESAVNPKTPKFEPPLKPKMKHVPKIFYGTRTHKQLSQVVAELKRLPLTDVLHTILGSRDQLCVNKEVLNDTTKSRNQACKEMLESVKTGGSGCGCHRSLKANYENPRVLRNNFLPGIWDIEDIKSASKGKHFCPYFGAVRVLAQDAQLILCPYNYLIDPLIRESMDFSLKDNIVVLDEAHNIEDACREAASFIITQTDLHSSFEHFKNVCSGDLLNPVSVVYEDDAVLHVAQLAFLCERVMRWLGKMVQFENDGRQERFLNDFKTKAKEGAIYSGFACYSAFTKELGITEMQLNNYWNNFSRVNEARSESTQKNEENNEAKAKVKSGPDSLIVSEGPMRIVESILFPLKFLYSSESARFDYKMCIKIEPSPPKIMTGKTGDKTEYKMNLLPNLPEKHAVLNFWCFNPALAFQDAFKDVHSVILASGTLSPLGTFESELGMKFNHKYEAPHVIERSQIFAAAVHSGPKNTKLLGTYRSYTDQSFQTDLGLLVGKVMSTVPGGVLVFFPSYNSLNLMREAWMSAGILSEMENHKVIFWEPKRSNQLPNLMEQYMQVIHESSKKTVGVTGAAIMGVCRGKVAEGVDFPDDAARAVISIGIPFPNFKDPQVEEKMKYNDTESKKRGLLDGNKWYSIQAFRALNQVLGRCIRHKNDWGGIILAESRFVDNMPSRDGLRPQEQISKWMRQFMVPYERYQTFQMSLESFMKSHTNQPLAGSTSFTGTPSQISLSNGKGGSSDRSQFFQENDPSQRSTQKSNVPNFSIFKRFT